MSQKRLRYHDKIKLSSSNEYYYIDANKNIRIIAGRIHHITGGTSTLRLLHHSTGLHFMGLCQVLAASGTCTLGYSINPQAAATYYNEGLTVDTKKMLLPQSVRIQFVGQTGAYVELLIEVIEIDSKTGEALA